jgi:hypothetical protein
MENAMYKIAALLFLTALAGHASAQDCPNRYRFVDFGLQNRDGVMRRGGTIFRAFDGQGADLLIPERSICVKVADLATDGRALPIPVVSNIWIDLEKAPTGLTGLQLKAVEDVVAAAEANAELHLAKLNQPDITITRGQSFLCASEAGTPGLSCQLLSPYGGNAPLVVYCDAQSCTMPILGRDEQLIIGSSWHRVAVDPKAVGVEIAERVQGIHDFLESQF